MNNPRGRGRGRGRGGNQNASQDQRKPPPPMMSQEPQPVTQNTTPAPAQEDKIAQLKARLKQNKTPVEKPVDSAPSQTTTAQTATPSEQTPQKAALKSDLLQLKLAALNKKSEPFTPAPTPTQTQTQKEESAQPKIMTRSARANAANPTAPANNTETTTSPLTPNVPENKPIGNRVITLNSKGNKSGTVIGGLNPNNRPTNANNTNGNQPQPTPTIQPTIPTKPQAPKLEAQKPEPPKPEIPKTEPSKPKDLPVPSQKNTVISLSGKPALPQGEKATPVTQPQTEKTAPVTQPQTQIQNQPVKAVEPKVVQVKPLRGESAPIQEPAVEKAPKEEAQEKAKSEKGDDDQIETEEATKEDKIQEETKEEQEEEDKEEEEAGDMEEEKPEESADKKVENTTTTQVQETKEKVASPPIGSPKGTTDIQVAQKTIEPTSSESLPTIQSQSQTEAQPQASTAMQEEQPVAKESTPEAEEEEVAAGEEEGEEDIDIDNEQLSTGSKKLRKNNGSPENISQGSPISKSSTGSKLQLKQQKKDAERIQKSMSELEEMVNDMEMKIPENLKHLVDYAQNINKKRPFNKRLAKVIKFFENFQV